MMPKVYDRERGESMKKDGSLLSITGKPFSGVTLITRFRAIFMTITTDKLISALLRPESRIVQLWKTSRPDGALWPTGSINSRTGTLSGAAAHRADLSDKEGCSAKKQLWPLPGREVDG